jgi:hypothetical protein
MRNDPKTIRKQRRPQTPGRRGSASSAAHPNPSSSQNAQRTYDRYLALARAELQIGNTIGAENYYQYAEHYFRSMSSDSGQT